jgi:branched-chain amino acid transport system substrate-binding protein
MKSNKILVAVLVLVAIVIVFIASKQDNGTDFRVGVIAPVTGNFAVLGERVKNGFTLAQEDLAREENYKVDVIIEDACQPKDAVSALKKLVENNKIDILGGSFCVTGFVSIIPFLEQYDIVGVNLAPNPDSVIGQKYVVSTNTSIKRKGTELGRFAADKLKAKTAAIIYYNTPLGEDYRKYFKESFEARGGNVVATQMTLVDATDFRTELTKVREQKPDVIFLVQLAKPLANLLRQSRELGIESIMLGNSQNEDLSVLKVAGIAAESFYISSDDPTPRTEVSANFDKRYEERFGQRADVFARNAYDALMLETNAYRYCGKSSECLLKELHAVKNYSGVSGLITIEQDGTAEKGTSFKVVRDGKFVLFEE